MRRDLDETLGPFLSRRNKQGARKDDAVNMKDTGKMVSALKRLGFDKVFDTNTGADFTIMEEATEFVKRFKENDNLPMTTSCAQVG